MIKKSGKPPFPAYQCAVCAPIQGEHQMSEQKKPIAAGKSSFALIRPDLLFAALDLKKETVFLDVACGQGHYSLAAAEFIGPQGAIHAVDLWPEGIELLRQAADERGLALIKPRVADVSEHIPLPDQQADVCLLATVLHDLKEVAAHEGALREIARVLKPDGRLAVVEFKEIEGPPGPPRHIRLGPEKLERLVQPHGFQKTRQLDLGPSTYLMLFRRL
jgi:ubiquinone/menaquinone biosynthesis C-methylase UbiE